MATLTNDQVRKFILEALYNHENKYPDPSDPLRNNLSLQKELQVSIAQINACISYLNQKGLITVKEVDWPEDEYKENQKFLQEHGKFGRPLPLYRLKITALGVDVVERKDQFAKEFPFMQVIQNISGNNYGNLTATQGNQNVITINQQITDAFKQAYDKVKDANLQPEQKEAINGQLKDLEQELHKEGKAEVGKIQKISKWFKDNANWVVPILSDVIKRGLEKACGI